ncbi:MAG: hypothetical protein DLM57_17710 [Pseudonocardiales bacterium]|nr:MAG: hypothetical protein DLM57_17710 [Pseudonocardiales bacterium]
MIHERCCHGLSASACSQRHTVDADTELTMPRRAASIANSGQLHFASGVPASAGSSQANALISAPARATGSHRGGVA